MKKLFIGILFVSQLLILTACFGSDDYIIEFSNINDRRVSLQTTGNLNVAGGVTVYQTDADNKVKNITSELQYEITDEKTGYITDVVPLTTHGKYSVYFYVIDPSEVKHDKSCTIIVGNPEVEYGDRSDLTYELVWSDEFDGNQLDESVWNYEIGMGQGGWGNNELQYYTKDPKNVSVSDGTLKITAINETIYGANYSSARLTTKGKQFFTYGKVEASIKVDSARGDWSAFWLLSETGQWPAKGEIDIMEHVGNDAGVFHANTHTERFHGGNLNGLGGKQTIYGFEEKFVTFGVEWLPDRLVFYIDDVEYYTYNPAHLNTNGQLTDDVWPFNHNFFIILNVAVGGNWGGANGGVTNSDFPSGIEVDYVRLYQSPEINNLMGA